MTLKQLSQACENNKDVILAILRSEFRAAHTALEIGSGTGQHAAYFAPSLEHLIWYTSDRRENHPSISAWIDECPATNLRGPLELDVCAGQWPSFTFDAVFSANTAHIMSWPAVECMFAGVGRALDTGGVFALYGPFRFGGDFTSGSNARFDAMLRDGDARMGVRDFEALDELALSAKLRLRANHAMPANNQVLVWEHGV